MYTGIKTTGVRLSLPFMDRFCTVVGRHDIKNSAARCNQSASRPSLASLAFLFPIYKKNRRMPDYLLAIRLSLDSQQIHEFIHVKPGLF